VSLGLTTLNCLCDMRLQAIPTGGSSVTPALKPRPWIQKFRRTSPWHPHVRGEATFFWMGDPVSDPPTGSSARW